MWPLLLLIPIGVGLIAILGGADDEPVTEPVHPLPPKPVVIPEIVIPLDAVLVPQPPQPPKPTPPGPAPKPRPNTGTPQQGPTKPGKPLEDIIEETFMQWEIDTVKDSRPEVVEGANISWKDLLLPGATIIDRAPPDPATTTIGRIIEAPPRARRLEATLHLSAYKGNNQFQPAGVRLRYSADFRNRGNKEVIWVNPKVTWIQNTPEMGFAYPHKHPPSLIFVFDIDHTRIMIVTPAGDGSLYKLTGPMRVYYRKKLPWE